MRKHRAAFEHKWLCYLCSEEAESANPQVLLKRSVGEASSSTTLCSPLSPFLFFKFVVIICCCLVAQSCLTLLQPHGLQHARPLCPSPFIKLQRSKPCAKNFIYLACFLLFTPPSDQSPCTHPKKAQCQRPGYIDGLRKMFSLF